MSTWRKVVVCLFAAVAAFVAQAAGPKVTIIGDSISTYSGQMYWSQYDYLAQYPDKTNITLAETWWKQVIDAIGGELVYNTSISGSRLACKTVADNGGLDFPPMSCNNRLTKEKLGGDDVDVFFIFGGTNDAQSHYNDGTTPPGDCTGYDPDTFDPVNAPRTTFASALEYMVWFLRSNYPNAQIWIIINDHVNDVLKIGDKPTFCDATDWEPYATVMQTVAAANENTYAVRLDLNGDYKCYEEKQWNNSDAKVHPTSAGMKAIADQVIAAYNEENPPTEDDGEDISGGEGTSGGEEAGGEVVSGEMVITTRDFDAGTFTLAFPAQSKAANLYLATTDDYDAPPDTWQNPVFLQQVLAGATSAEVTVPNWSPESVQKYRFLLADPESAKVQRYDCVEGQGGAFMTDLYPDASTACELTFAMTSLTPDQSWLFCARKDQGNTASDYLLAVRGGADSNADKSRFGYNATGNLTGGNKLSVGTKYTFVATIASSGSKKYFKLTPADDETTIVHNEVFDYVEKFAQAYRMSFGGSSTAGTFDGITAQTAFAKYYSFKMWESVGGALQADYRPCTWKDLQQRVHVGFYDVVSGAFYEAGTHIESQVGSFIVPDDAEELPVDTLVDHLGTPLAATAIIVTSLKSEVVSEEGFTQYEFNGLPKYGSFFSDVGETKTFTAPAGEFDFVREDGRLEQVKCCGVRIDVYDQNLGRFVNGPVQKTTSCTWTKQLYDEIVRIVWLWDVRRKTTSFSGLRADSLRLKADVTNNGWVEPNCGFFDTGIHPNPQTTRVSFKVRMVPFVIANQHNFFGVRQGSDAAVKRNSSFFLCRTGQGVRLDLCGTAYVGANELFTPVGFLGNNEWLEFDILNGDVKYRNASTNKEEYQGRVSERDNIELTPTLPIFGQARYDNDGNKKFEQALDAPKTEYSAFTVWTNGTVLARDYVPCLDDQKVPCFYDLVYDEYCYPNDGSKDKYEAVMDEGNNLVITAEPAEYFDCGKPMYGREKLANGQSKTYTMTERKSFRMSVSGYRIDTWDKDNGGWEKDTPQSGRTVTLTGDETKIRRLVWLWGKAQGMCVILY